MCTQSRYTFLKENNVLQFFFFFFKLCVAFRWVPIILLITFSQGNASQYDP
uniref:Uncharacterized protein n=1 Tax=Anguilla anguilla TaxID=7936 RepID=A0A0E9TUR2_ANGAN